MLAAVLFLALTSPVTFTDFRTDQGMRVLLAPDASAPAVAVSLTYDFGSRNERRGQTGVANLLHTALLRDLQRQCKEKLRIPEAERDEACRGSHNQERTSYTLTVPADRLEAALSLLAGQMRAAGVDVDSVRAEILEKRRNEDAYARAAETLLDLSFTRFPYKHGAEGSEADLKALTAADVSTCSPTSWGRGRSRGSTRRSSKRSWWPTSRKGCPSRAARASSGSGSTCRPADPSRRPRRSSTRRSPASSGTA